MGGIQEMHHYADNRHIPVHLDALPTLQQHQKPQLKQPQLHLKLLETLHLRLIQQLL